MKNCQEIAQEIEALKKTFSKVRKKKFLAKITELSEQSKCDSESSTIKCEKCNCWKSSKE